MNASILSLVALLSAPSLGGLAVPALPGPVMATLNRDWPGFLLDEVEQEGANWEVELTTAGGARLEVLLDPGGTVLHSFAKAEEQKIAVGDLPAAVSAAVAAGWPGATSREAERKGTAYEVEITTTAGVQMELLLQADGGLIATVVETEDGEGDDADED